MKDLFLLLRRQDSNLRPLGYEPNELPLLHSCNFFLIYLVDTIFFEYFAHSFNQNVQYDAYYSFKNT